MHLTKNCPGVDQPVAVWSGASEIAQGLRRRRGFASPLIALDQYKWIDVDQAVQHSDVEEENTVVHMQSSTDCLVDWESDSVVDVQIMPITERPGHFHVNKKDSTQWYHTGHGVKLIKPVIFANRCILDANNQIRSSAAD